MFFLTFQIFEFLRFSLKHFSVLFKPVLSLLQVSCVGWSALMNRNNSFWICCIYAYDVLCFPLTKWLGHRSENSTKPCTNKIFIFVNLIIFLFALCNILRGIKMAKSIISHLFLITLRYGY